MNILTQQLPSGGFGYSFPSVRVSPMNFVQICNYLENLPPESSPLERYLHDINMLIREDETILDCYVMDVDFLIFYKKLCTVSGDLSYTVKIKCPHCGNEIKTTINLERDVHFKAVDPKIMNGAKIELGGHIYETCVPTLRQFLGVFNKYLRYKKISDLKMIKTISLIKDFEMNGNQVERDVLEATHEDITLLLALRELYFDKVEPVEIKCSGCIEKAKKEKDNSKLERSGMVAVGVDSLIVDFFRDLIVNSPIDGSKILFK